jgi:hypothetical protein
VGYYGTGFIVAREGSRQVREGHSSLRAVPLEQGVVLFPLTQEIVDSIVTANQFEPLPQFQYLNKSLSAFLAKISVLCPVLYLETEYFGGMGAQTAMVLEKGNVVFGPRTHSTDDGKRDLTPISEALQVLGVMKQPHHSDQFDCVGLGRYRDHEDWLSSIP